MKTIAIIDDDVPIGDMLEELLRREGYAVLRAYSGTEALYLLREKCPDLILLDLMLPGLPGEEVLPRIKGIPVIVLSAKADVQDKVALLLGGAADYMTKPFDTSELLARIAVQLRESSRPGAGSSLTVGELCLDYLTQGLTVGGVPVKLTRTEYAIIKLLMENKGQVISKGALLERISLDTPDCTERGISPEISLPPEPVWRMADAAALSRIFSNIISNALKYSDGDLRVSMDSEGNVSFENTAKDLDAVTVGRLFDRFYTVQASRRSTGLGLSIARLLTERLDGKLAAEYTDNILRIKMFLPG